MKQELVSEMPQLDFHLIRINEISLTLYADGMSAHLTLKARDDH